MDGCLKVDHWAFSPSPPLRSPGVFLDGCVKVGLCVPSLPPLFHCPEWVA